MVTRFQDALRDRTVILPEQLDLDDLVELHNSHQINDDQLINMTNIRTALSQLCHLRYVTNRSGKRVKTSHGVFTYTAPGKKDVAWTMLMGHLMCDVLVQIKKLQDSNENDSSYLPDVE